MEARHRERSVPSSHYAFLVEEASGDDEVNILIFFNA